MSHLTDLCTVICTYMLVLPQVQMLLGALGVLWAPSVPDGFWNGLAKDNLMQVCECSCSTVLWPGKKWDLTLKWTNALACNFVSVAVFLYEHNISEMNLAVVSDWTLDSIRILIHPLFHSYYYDYPLSAYDHMIEYYLMCPFVCIIYIDKEYITVILDIKTWMVNVMDFCSFYVII